MAITAKEDISVARKDIKESRSRRGSIETTKSIIFKHRANAGTMIINTLALNTPATSAAKGFNQPDLGELSALNLLLCRKNLRVHSSRGAWLQEYEDYVVTGANTIQFVGSLEALGGAEQDEIFTVYATPIATNAFVVTDVKKQYQEYTLADGAVTLNLGREYEVGANITRQIGSIRVWRNGVGPLLRNVGNAAAAPSADGNYQEVDAGNGLGTTIAFNIPPSGQSDIVVVEFGQESASDLSIIGDVQALYGAILKLADDVKDLGPFPISKYITANPSDVERRAFGDSVLSLLTRMGLVEADYLKGGATGLIAVSAYIQNNGTATIVRQDGVWLQSVVRSSPGSTVGTFVPGYFAPGVIPNLVTIPKHLSGVSHMSADFQSIDANGFNMFTPGVDGINRDTDYMIIAIGKKAT